VLVCGLDGIARRTIEQLQAIGVRVVLLEGDEHPQRDAVVRELGVPWLDFARHDGRTLLAAGLEGARAVVCAEEDDLRTLETALLARDLRADVRVIVHLDNPSVGRAVERLTGSESVLDVAGLFAPSVVEACLGGGAETLELAGERFLVADEDVVRPGTLRELFGDLAPVALVRADRELVSGPGRDEPVAPGDRVSLIGTPAEFARAGLEPAPADERPRSRRLGARARQLGYAVGEVLDRPVRATLAVAGVVFLLCAVVLKLAYVTPGGGRMSALESLYFTIETAATVGFGDFSFAAQSGAMQVFGIALIVFGTAVVSLLFALITNALVTRRLEHSLGRGRIRGLEGHVVLAGLGSVGMRVLEGLVEAGREVVVVERDDDNRRINQARALGVPVVIGDATLQPTLERAGVATAAAVALMTSDDLTNLEAGLAVRGRLGDRWAAVPVILRVFDRALAHRLEGSFGFRNVWSTSAIAAPWFAGAAAGFGVLSTFYAGNEPFLVARLPIAPGGGLAGVPMRDLSARVRVVAIGRAREGGRLEHPPRRDTRLEAGDEAYLAGPYEELLETVRQERLG
jgi:Trk K+ transport system NAD-binding subunit